MAPKKPTKPAKPKPQPTRLQNLAARPASFDSDTMDEQLVDNSGVFRVTSAIAQAQTGHEDEESSLRFASDSLVMQAQRDGFREDGPTLDEPVDETAVAAEAEKRARLATLAARAQAVRNRSRR